jgi:hypothetical protein
LLDAKTLAAGTLIVNLIRLWKVESGNKGVVTDYDEMTIEHLLPESAFDFNSDFGESEHIGALGNLILVPQKLNVLLDSKPFLQKRQILNRQECVS